MQYDLYIKNANIVMSDVVVHGGILIKDEKYAAFVTDELDIDAVKVIDAGNNYVFPGLIDTHVHINEPGRTEWDDYYSGTCSCVAGGITTPLVMPLNATPPTTNLERLKERSEIGASQIVCDVAHWGGLVNNNLSDLEGLNEGGVIGYKAFLSDSATDFERIDDDLIYAGLVKTKEFGNVVGLHAENEYITKYLTKCMKEAGRTDRAAWSESRPEFAELEAVRRACTINQAAKGHLHICHVSIASGIREIEKFRNEGVDISAETCAHYLFFDEKMFEAIGPDAKCAPPLRSRDNVEQMWELCKNGWITNVASDHSPCTKDLKEKGKDNIWEAWGGINGNECLLSVMLSEGYHKRGLSLTRIAALTSGNPAKRFGLDESKGAIQIGLDADFCIVDINKEWTFKVENMHTKNKHSAYDGRTFKGQVLSTYVRGKLVYDDGKVVAEPGYGKYLRRQHAA